jgi:two-component system phosphate regulon sensor histidine kinase PhoR
VLFRRLFLSFLLLIAAVTAGIGIFAVDRLRASRIEATQEALQQEAKLLESRLGEDVEAGRFEDAARVLRSLPLQERRRATLIDGAGKVLADTAADPATMENHRLRPEIVHAAAAGEGFSIRPSGTVLEDMVYYARRLRGPGGGEAFLRVAMPMASLDAHLRALTWALGTTAAAAVLAAGVLCFVWVRRQTAPVVQLTGVARSVAGGNLAQRARTDAPGDVGALARALNSMADTLAGLLTQASKDREELRTILASMADGVIATDRAQRVLLVNPAAGSLLDFDASAAAGRSLWEVVREEAVLKAAPELLASGGRRVVQVGPVRGRTLEIALCAWGRGPDGPVPSEAGGRVEGLVAVAHDTTEAARYQELRKEFVANVSHELRTPLTLIRGFVETLRDGALGDAAKGPEYLAIIDKHVAQLTNLVDDLLDLSRVESRPGLLRRVEVDVAEVVRRAVELHEPAAKKKEQTLTTEIAPDVPRVIGDPDALERAVANLVDNAVKYTPERGSIRVTARAETDGVAVVVADTGIGIPEEDRARVFERFYRVDKSRSRELGGTGLGLAIVKHVAQLHGGSVTLESAVGRGSVFTLRLPANSGSRS